MEKKHVKEGETYLFVATTSPARKHLEGQPFHVEYKKRVFRKKNGRITKVLRFFNIDGIGARAEELAEMPEQVMEMSFDFNAVPPADGVPVILQHQEPGFNHDWSGAGATEEPVRELTEREARFIAGEDPRDWPCEECEDGEMIFEGGAPNGQQHYRCNSCGKTASFP